jgi:hypothetical protein
MRRPSATAAGVRESPSKSPIGDHLARSNKQRWALATLSILSLAGLISLTVGINLHGSNFACPSVVPVAANLKAWCEHTHAMYNLGLTLFIIGIVVAFFGAVAARAVFELGSSQKSLHRNSSPL